MIFFSLIVVSLTPNIARNGIASQISSYKEHAHQDRELAKYAIDGVYSTDSISVGRCAHTGASDVGDWWRVDLKQIYHIRKVAITTRHVHGKFLTVSYLAVSFLIFL